MNHKDLVISAFDIGTGKIRNVPLNNICSKQPADILTPAYVVSVVGFATSISDNPTTGRFGISQLQSIPSNHASITQDNRGIQLHSPGEYILELSLSLFNLGISDVNVLLKFEGEDISIHPDEEFGVAVLKPNTGVSGFLNIIRTLSTTRRSILRISYTLSGPSGSIVATDGMLRLTQRFK